VPSETGADLAVLAALVTAADTKISRAADSQDSWTREIDLYVPVYEPVLWTDLASLIARILNFLTGDHWRLVFRERNSRNRELIIASRSRIHLAFNSISLFSGGLDSFIGAIDLLEAGEAPLFVSHYGDNSTSSQERCTQRLAGIYGDVQQRHVRANVRFDKNDFAHPMAEEATTRGRSFLFLGLAALAASGMRNSPVIYVPENGLISLNVPLDPLRVGAWSTRTTHPFYIARWQELLNGLGIAGTLENPYRFATKGEMLSGCVNGDLARESLVDTISCSSITKARWLGLSPRHCGFCVPCLIRRAAITSAFGSDPTTYTIRNLSAQPLNSKSPEGEHVRAFQEMARRLIKRPSLSRLLIHKPGPLSDFSDADIAEYSGVFSRGISEVDSVTGPAVVRPN
jgi:7-cyano-7-deazaguanine synthase in queuosine biosynthesis